jgi:DNA-binding transcriptional LysR family regulator
VGASKKLHLSQPALTRSIQSLESELGLQLFDRVPSGVVLTAEGKLVLARARDLLQQSQALYRDTLSLGTGERSIVAFGIDPILSGLVLPTLLSAIIAGSQLMQTEVKVESRSTLLLLLNDNLIEFFVADLNDFKPIERQHLTVESVGRLRGSLYVRHDHELATATAVTDEQLATYPVITPSNVHESRWDPFNWQARAGSSGRRQQIICPDLPTLLHLVHSTNAILAAPDYAVTEAVAAGALVRLNYLTPHYSDDREMGLVTRRDMPLTVHAQRILEHIRQALRR